MYPALQKELDTFERRTPKSAEAHKKNLKRLPLGVASNYRAYDPYPIFVSEASWIKFEGGYHGLDDGALVSVKPHPPGDDFGDIKNPKAVSAGAGVPKASIANVLVATFNDLETVERRFKENPNEVAAIILEPIMMNVGLCMPQKGFLEGLRELCDKHGALLIFDEVKTGAKLGWGGASGYFGETPDMICLARSLGGGGPVG